MGGMFNKFQKHDSSNCESSSETATVPGDPRSPSQGIQRTPIVISEKPYLETDIDAVTPINRRIPLRVQVLQKGIDPRSPTAGINRTPLGLVESIRSGQFGTPVSVYSNNLSELDSMSLWKSPSEPPVIVSDFEESFSGELDSLVERLEESYIENKSFVEEKPQIPVAHKTCRLEENGKLADKQFCRDLINEIIDSFKEYEETLVEPKRHLKKNKTLTLSSGDSTPKTPKTSGLKVRKPFANLSNTPNKNALRTSDKFVKVVQMGENLPVTPVKGVTRTQWDMESTLII